MEILNHVRNNPARHSQPEPTVVNSILSQSLNGRFAFVLGKQPFVRIRALSDCDKHLGHLAGGFLHRGKMKKHSISLYGSVALERGYCENCKAMAIIKGGIFQCCDTPVENAPTKFERMSQPFYGRKTPTKADKDRIINKQGNKCFYCDVTFGSIRFRRGLPFTIKIEWDHKLPFAYSQNNHVDNFVASCHVCNGIKSDNLFQTIQSTSLGKEIAGK
jgi:hypothetical protein